MRKDKEMAISLRRSGKSYAEIMDELGVPKSTLSDWFRDQQWSNDIALKCVQKSMGASKTRLVHLNNVRGVHLKNAYEEAEKEAREDFEMLKYHPLFIAGLMIYWGEGDKTSKYRVSIANTEARMIRIFRLFLKNICGVDKPRVWLLLYPDLMEEVCKKYWMSESGLNKEYFTKSIIIKGRSQIKKLSYGVCNIGITSAYLKRKIIKWIEFLAEDLSQEKYNAGVV